MPYQMPYQIPYKRSRIHTQHLNYIKEHFKAEDYSELFFLNYIVPHKQSLKLEIDYSLNILDTHECQFYYDGWEVWEFSCVLQGTGKNRLGIPTLPMPETFDKKNKALFLDRDGILTVDHGYVKSFKDTKIMNGVIPFLTEMKKQGFTFFVLTNQSGVARNMFSLEDVHHFHDELSENLDKSDLKIERFEICPYYIPETNNKNHMVSHYAKYSYLRKPYPGMIFNIARDYYLDIDEMFMVGDKLSDKIILPGLNTYLLNHHFKNYDELLKQILS